MGDRELLIWTLGGLREVSDALLGVRGAGQAFQSIQQLAMEIHKHLKATAVAHE